MDKREQYAQSLLEASAKQLQAERAAAGMTYKEVADAAGMTEQTVMRYMTARRDIPMTAFGAMAGALGIDAVTLMRRAMDRL